MVLAPPHSGSTRRDHAPTGRAVLEVVVPVHDEAEQLEESIRRLRSYLDDEFPFAASVTIVDNGSTDATPEIAANLARSLKGVHVINLSEKGRGRALRAAWSTTRADVVCYTDVDLSTSLDALLPLVAPLLSGHSDLAIGSRLAPGAHVVRGAKRELISRTYNLVLRATLHNGFTDAQCGFKAIRADVARELLPLVEDDSWFFDTELLVVAERSGLRIHEVPVDWTDDPDSRVQIVRTAADDLRGVWRLLLRRRRAATAVSESRAVPLESTRRFAEVGIGSTIAYALMFFLLRGWLGNYGSNTLSVAVCTLGNAMVHRRLATRDDRNVPSGLFLGMLAAFVPALAFTTIGLSVADSLGGRDLWILVSLLVASAAAAVVRFAAFSSIAFHNRPDSRKEVVHR
jgi:glycosyltransferase involved in cell wall biosynthesis